MTRNRDLPSAIELDAAARRAHMPARRVRQYIRAGVIQPKTAERGRLLFDDIDLARLRRIRRLADDLGLDSGAIDIVLRLLDQIEALQRELEARDPARAREARR
jgi:DNA-binding transcriptional MerR regulator